MTKRGSRINWTIFLDIFSFVLKSKIMCCIYCTLCSYNVFCTEAEVKFTNTTSRWQQHCKTSRLIAVATFWNRAYLSIKSKLKFHSIKSNKTCVYPSFFHSHEHRGTWSNWTLNWFFREWTTNEFANCQRRNKPHTLVFSKTDACSWLSKEAKCLWSSSLACDGWRPRNTK